MAAPTAAQRGYFEKVYIDTADDFTTPTLVEIAEAEDSQWSATPEAEDVMLKKHAGIKRSVPYGSAIAASFNVKALPVDYLTSKAYYVKLRNASLSGNPIHLQFSDGDITTAGKEYLKAWWTVTFNKSAPSGGTVDIQVSLSPADSPEDEKPVFGTTSS